MLDSNADKIISLEEVKLNHLDEAHINELFTTFDLDSGNELL
jgi:hypothetical protein